MRRTQDDGQATTTGEWANLTLDQCNTVRDTVGQEENTPTGGQIHVAWFGTHGLDTTDDWDSERAFHTSFTERLTPAVTKAGITGKI
ncbi:hypothetical protein [Streptomyces sp. NPDC096013]|uniref:hypothetical protein n=1 Tax=Streptomyces sp. NPDC096013 TaxID=3366069 RepID=UPI003807A3C0